MFQRHINSLLKAVLSATKPPTPPITLDNSERKRWFENINILLEEVWSWLRTSDEQDDWWKLKTHMVQMCFTDMSTLASISADRDNPESEALRRALPHVAEMVTAMTHRDRAKALDEVNAALVELSDDRAAVALRPLV